MKLALKKNLSIVPQESILLSIKGNAFSIITIVSILIQSILFMGTIGSDGASKYIFNSYQVFQYKTLLVILFSMIIVSFSYLFSRGRFIILSIFNLLYSILIIGDLWYYRGFSDFLSIHSLGETGNLGNFNKIVLSMARPIDSVFIVEDVLFLLIMIIIFKTNKINNRSIKGFLISFTIPSIIIFGMHMKYDSHGDDYAGPVLFKTQYIPYSTMQNLTPIGYHFYDGILYVRDTMLHSLNSKDKQSIDDWISYKNENLPDNSYAGMMKGKNVIFLQVESLENFVINQKYNGQEITPNLNKLLSNSLYFSNFYEQVNNGNSGDADLMANASVLPVRRGSTFYRYPKNDYTTIAGILKNESYVTKSMHASDGAIWNVSAAIKNFGFDNSMELNSFKGADIYGMGVTDKDFLSKVISSVKEEKQPFYYYTVTVTSHEPFDLRDDMKSLKFTDNFGETAMGKYFDAIHYTDEAIGDFIKSLNESGLADNTMVVIYGDHTGVHKYDQDKIANLSEYQSWWDDDTKVPFIIYNKNIKGEEKKTMGGEVDILPTVSYLLGIDKEKYENTSMGRNLLNTNKNYAILNNGTIKGEESLTQQDIEHVKKSFDIADLIIETNYFSRSKNNK
ncbi:LTA synthase family protein [Clostridium sp. 19966]|uniref:LTA synthase family protein n=1 Tax=Clostridium sp. 19966 TaxID=2768166 RepID=UPI0028DE4115|nr:LTA synthase family protein [Clostridium sp. 19966]MDT8715187.1 LTA synthase family protein [Clostridium sp. 19966]